MEAHRCETARLIPCNFYRHLPTNITNFYRPDLFRDVDKAVRTFFLVDKLNIQGPVAYSASSCFFNDPISFYIENQMKGTLTNYIFSKQYIIRLHRRFGLAADWPSLDFCHLIGSTRRLFSLATLQFAAVKSMQRPFGRFVPYKILDFRPWVLTRQLAKKRERLQGIVINYCRRARRLSACLGVAGKSAHKTARLCYPLYPRQLCVLPQTRVHALFSFLWKLVKLSPGWHCFNDIANLLCYVIPSISITLAAEKK